jgi:hypothetical protein
VTSNTSNREVERPPRWLLAIGAAVILPMLALAARSVSRSAQVLCRMRPERVAHMRAGQLASEAYGEWSLAHPERSCPASIDEMARDRDAFDPWGRTYRVMCTENHVVIVSAGADGTFGTADDISNLREPE